MTANHLAIRRALVRQFDLEDKRREINRELCGVRAGIRNLLGVAPPVGTRARKSRRAGKRGGEEQHNRMHPMNGTIRAKTAGRKRNGKGAAK